MRRGTGGGGGDRKSTSLPPARRLVTRSSQVGITWVGKVTQGTGWARHLFHHDKINCSNKSFFQSADEQLWLVHLRGLYLHYIEDK